MSRPGQYTVGTVRPAKKTSLAKPSGTAKTIVDGSAGLLTDDFVVDGFPDRDAAHAGAKKRRQREREHGHMNRTHNKTSGLGKRGENMKQVLGYYLLLINAVGFLIMCIDKLLAKKQARRVPERTLLWVAALGGSFEVFLA